MDYIETVFNLDPLLPGREILIAELASAGFESFEETETGLNAWIQETDFDRDVVQKILDHYSGLFSASFHHGPIETVNWNEAWEKNYPPVVVDGVCGVRAPFHPPRPDLAFDIVIEPKMSFGTAHHPTTVLMIRWLLELDLAGKEVLDMGCGTGILTILASRKNATSVTAIDNYPLACENTMENAQRNNIHNMMTIQGDAGALEELNRRFDLVMANINRNVLLEDLSVYERVLKDDHGMILISGFFSTDEDVMYHAATASGMLPAGTKQAENWSSLLFTRKHP